MFPREEAVQLGVQIPLDSNTTNLKLILINSLLILLVIPASNRCND